tara:strand:- start:220 stop:450 length:231 start_codon:yes stop_codon:yes gene_type:complete
MIAVKTNTNNDELLIKGELYTVGISNGTEWVRVKYLGTKPLNGKPMMVFKTIKTDRQITVNPSFHTFTITESKRGQ